MLKAGVKIMVSVCTGAFLSAEAGLLNNKKATITEGILNLKFLQLFK